MLNRAGIYYGMDAATYHADPCPLPSFSQSLGKILIDKSPAHARLKHPRLAPEILDEEEVAEKYDSAKAIGNAAHALMLGRGRELAEGPFPDWRTKEARAFRDEHATKIVILSKHLRRAAAMVNAARETIKLVGWKDCFQDAGQAEVVMLWEEPGTWMRTMIDWKVTQRPLAYDYKTSAMTVAPHALAYLIEDAGWHIQAAMHERGLHELEPGTGPHKFRFLAQEQYAPFAASAVELDEPWMTMGRKKLQFAIDLWKMCIEKDIWPGYPLVQHCPPYPGYREQQWLERETAQAAQDRQPHDLIMAG